jgi:hypothetical protein
MRIMIPMQGSLIFFRKEDEVDFGHGEQLEFAKLGLLLGNRQGLYFSGNCNPT